MDSHPIPQQISSYQFRLVGDMTLKQFFQIAGGALISIIIYSLPILGIIKWPLVILSALLGIALAFLPLEERPLEKWLLAFFRSVYSPTHFSWKKTNENINFYQDEAPIPNEKILYPGGEEKLQEYLKTSQSGIPSNLEKTENTFLSGLTNIFTSFIPLPKAQVSQTPVSTSIPTSSSNTGIPVPYLSTTPVTNTSMSSNNLNTNLQPQIKVVEEKKPELEVPREKPVGLPTRSVPVPVPSPKLVVEESNSQGVVSQTIPVSPITPNVYAQNTATQGVQFSIDSAPPNPPTTPNTLTGQVVDSEKHIIEGAILEIKDVNGRPVRALRSNKLGHFMVVTPLMSGKYEIVTEKEGFNFEPLTFEANGSIIPPVAITGKKYEN